MSCDGWSVGDRCRVRVAFAAVEKQIGGQDIVTSLNVGDQGTVQEKHAHLHMLYVFWGRLKRALPISHDQIHLLDKVGG